MFVVDTNVLVYAANRDAPEHMTCRQRLLDWLGQPAPWFLTWSIVYEFLRVVTHRRVLPSPLGSAEAWSFVEVLLDSPSLQVLTPTRRHAELLRELLVLVPRLEGNLFHDAHTAALMREHGVKTIITRDSGFYRFGFLEVVDPLD